MANETPYRLNGSQVCLTAIFSRLLSQSLDRLPGGSLHLGDRLADHFPAGGAGGVLEGGIIQPAEQGLFTNPCALSGLGNA